MGFAYLGYGRLGAATAVLAFMAFPENPVALSIFGFFFAIPCFYYIVGRPQYATSGRFVLLTYNLTCLYWYGSRLALLLPLIMTR